MQLKSRYAPVPEDTRAILRQKTLLGETYVELTPGSPSAPKLPEGGTLTHNNVEPTVQLDEILRVFDPQTKEAWREWQRGAAQAVRGRSGEAFNDALGNLPGFATDSADTFQVLNDQSRALKLLVRNTGVVFGALSEREGQLRGLIRNSKATFEATAREREALAETFRIFPTFLDESRLTMASLERFSRDTNPLLSDLKPVADDLHPTVRDLAALSPDLKQLFLDLRPVIRESDKTLPQAARFLRGARPVFEGLHTFLPELNPILSFVSFNQQLLGTFINNGSSPTSLKLPSGISGHRISVLNQFGITNERSLSLQLRRPPYERGNAYGEPSYINRVRATGIAESWDCDPNGGEQNDPQEGDPPCFIEPDSLWPDGTEKFPRVGRGIAPNI